MLVIDVVKDVLASLAQWFKAFSSINANFTVSHYLFSSWREHTVGQQNRINGGIEMSSLFSKPLTDYPST